MRLRVAGFSAGANSELGRKFSEASLLPELVGELVSETRPKMDAAADKSEIRRPRNPKEARSPDSEYANHAECVSK
jgi:hypothetical protein